jgi:hypothetical protein
MYDMVGKKVRFEQLGEVFKGQHTFEFNVSDLESGMYIMLLDTGNSQISKKIRVQ